MGVEGALKYDGHEYIGRVSLGGNEKGNETSPGYE